jgi:hypothetical protein
MLSWAVVENGKAHATPAESKYFLQRTADEVLRRNNAMLAENSWSTGPI